jgi:hypothetical protein
VQNCSKEYPSIESLCKHKKEKHPTSHCTKCGIGCAIVLLCEQNNFSHHLLGIRASHGRINMKPPVSLCEIKKPPRRTRTVTPYPLCRQLPNLVLRRKPFRETIVLSILSLTGEETPSTLLSLWIVAKIAISKRYLPILPSRVRLQSQDVCRTSLSIPIPFLASSHLYPIHSGTIILRTALGLTMSRTPGNIMGRRCSRRSIVPGHHHLVLGIRRRGYRAGGSCCLR